MKTKNIHSFITGNLLLGAMLLANACTDRLEENPVSAPADGTVPVTFTIGIADEQDGYDQGTDGKSRSINGNRDDGQGFEAQVVPTPNTRAAGNKPEKVYQLQVIQFNQSGGKLNTPSTADYDAGKKMTVDLATATDCQLLFIAAGEEGSISKYPSGNLSTLTDYQQLISNVDFTKLSTDENVQADINKQPYVLYLPHVNVTSTGIESPGLIDGTGQDVRILLKRLAAKLNLQWNFNVSGYTLTEVRLSDVSGTIPTNAPNHATGRFFYYPARENNGNYPTADKEYVDYFRLKDAELAKASGNYTIWMPASVRGTSPKVTAPQHRNKDNAPSGASYVEFIAEKTESGAVKDRLFYRVYLGGAAVNNFNVEENTNYTWKVNINSANVADPRITRMDLTPVQSKNQRNTSNCFMVIPGTDFWFNPYKHEAGTSGWNDQLVNNPLGSPSIKNTIKSVKILWQTRDNGTSGELVLGRYISATNHTNIVNCESLSSLNNAKVHIKVPVTQGGNAVIAAYNGSNQIVWSWHLWITDYVPSRINTAIGYSDYPNAQKRSQNGTVHKYRSDLFKDGKVYANMVMMDRDLGALKGGYAGLGGASYSIMDGVKRLGLLYQWGRKDPFFTSADGTTNERNTIYDGDGVPSSVGKTFYTNALNGNSNTLQYTIQYPLSYIPTNTDDQIDWYRQNVSSIDDGGGWRWNQEAENKNYAPGKKSIYDPSPEGWKIPMANVNGKELGFDNSILEGVNNTTYFIAKKPESTYRAKNGRLFLLEGDNEADATIHNTAWFNLSPERFRIDGRFNSATLGHLWFGDMKLNSTYNSIQGCVFQYDEEKQNNSLLLVYSGNANGWQIRCIQDNK